MRFDTHQIESLQSSRDMSHNQPGLKFANLRTLRQFHRLKRSHFD
jgi:hypothetical protein